MSQHSDILARLMAVIQDRKANPTERSYTTSLLRGGVDKIGAKILEEAQEVVEAAQASDEAGQQQLIHEAADLIYHLCVLLGFREVQIDQVYTELARRFGVSGIDEKESRLS